MKPLDYYSDKYARLICHAVKQDFDMVLRKEAETVIAEYLIGLDISGPDCEIIPAPQHHGHAEYTREIAEMVSVATGASVADIVRCVPHEPFYRTRNRDDLKFFLEGRADGDKKLLFLDNVICTGSTFEETQKLFSRELIPFVYAVDYRRCRNLAQIEKRSEI